MSEKRSSVESQKAPNRDTVLVMCATLPSMKSKMLATIMMTPASRNRSMPSAQAAADVDQDADERERVRVDAAAPRWRAMIARSGNMHTVPMNPVNGHSLVIIGGSESSGTKLVIVAHGHPGPQGTDRAVARAARRLPVGQRGRRDDLRRQGALAARPRAQLPGRLRASARGTTRCSRRSRRSRSSSPTR